MTEHKDPFFKLMPKWVKQINVFRAYSAHVNTVK